MRQACFTRFSMYVFVYCLSPGFENVVGKPIVTDSPRKHDRSHHCCDCARGDLASCIRRRVRKLTSDHFNHCLEFVCKRATSFLRGTPNIRCQGWKCAAMRLIVTMAATQIGRHDGIEAFLSRDSPRKLLPTRSSFVHCRRKRLLDESVARCK